MSALPAEPTRPGLLTRFRQDAFWYRQRGAALSYCVLAAMLVLLAVTVPGTFYSTTNLSNLAGQLAPLFLVALGQTFVLLSAGFDLSVGAVISLSSAILTLDMADPVKIPLAFSAAAAVGLVNGWGCVHLRVHPIIMTLAMATFLQGLLVIVAGGSAVTVSNPAVILLGQSRPLGIPAGIILWLVVSAVVLLLVHRMPIGARFLARGMPAQVYEAAVHQRAVLIEFDSVAQAIAAHDSPAYQAALDALGDGAERDIRIIEAAA